MSDTMTMTFDRLRAHYVLEALRVCDAEWERIATTSEDDDIQSDYTNDRMELHILQEAFERIAVEAFGPVVKEFSREPMK